MNITDVVETKFKNELSNYFDDYNIKAYWFVKFEEYNPALNGCSLRIRYIDTEYSESYVDIDIWEKRMSSDNYTFKFIIKDILQHHNNKIEKIIDRLGVWKSQM